MKKTSDKIVHSKKNKLDANIQYDIALALWQKKNFMRSEFWCRYAAMQNDKRALSQLKLGIKQEYYQDTLNRLRSGIIDLLESLITPFPTEQQICALETVLINHFSKKIAYFKKIAIKRNKTKAKKR